jgi:hypothetical protein
MRWRQIGLRAVVRFAGLNSLRRFAARRDLWRQSNSQDQSASAFGRASDSNLPMAIAAEKAHLRTAEQPSKARSQDVARNDKSDNAEKEEKRHVGIRRWEQ